MYRNFKRFVGSIFFAVLFILVLGWFVFTYLIPDKYLQVLPLMLAFFTLVTLLSHGYQLKLVKKDIGRFTRNSMVVSMLRLVLYSIFAFVYLAGNKENIAVFVVSLVFVYSVFTIIEVTSLARFMRPK